jgi:hypothetical protein
MANATGIAFLHQIELGTISDPNDPNANLLSVTSTAAGDFEGWYMFTDTIRQVWRSVDTNLQEIVFKSDIPVRIDTLAILGHNFSNLAVVTLEANSINDFTAPPIQVNLTVSARNMVMLNDLGFDLQYYKLKILDPLNECGYIEIGRICGGTRFQFIECEDIKDDFSISYVDYGQKLTNEGFSRPANKKILARRLDASFAKMSTLAGQDDNYQGLLSLIDNVRTTLPFLTILDPGNPTLFLAWTEFEDLPSFEFTINGYVEAKLRVEEVF